MFEGPAVVIAYLGGDRGVVVCAPLQERMSALTALEVPKEAAARRKTEAAEPAVDFGVVGWGVPTRAQRDDPVFFAKMPEAFMTREVQTDTPVKPRCRRLGRRTEAATDFRQVEFLRAETAKSPVRLSNAVDSH
jgi:hypothetical protein